MRTTSRMTTGASPKRRRNPRVGWNINEHVCSADAQRSPTKYCKLTWNHFVVGSFAAVMMVFLCTLCCAELGFRADRRRLASSSSTSASSDNSSSTSASSDNSSSTSASSDNSSSTSASSDDVTGKCEKYPEKHTTPEACKAADCKSWMIFAGQVQAVKACLACKGKGMVTQQSYSNCIVCSGRGTTSDDPVNAQIWYKPHDKSFVYIRDNDSKEHFTIFQAGRGYESQQLLENKEWILIELKGHGVFSIMRNRWFHVNKSEAFLKFILHMPAPNSTTKQGNFRPSDCTQCNGRGCSGCSGGSINRLSETRHAIMRKFQENESSEEESEPDTPFYKKWWKNSLDCVDKSLDWVAAKTGWFN